MRRSWTRLLVPTLLLCLAPASALAVPEPQEGIALADLFPGAVFDPEIPTQEEVLGFRPAVRPMRHAELMQYLGVLVEASPRVRMIEYSRSHEGRPLVYLAVGDEAVVGELDAFREAHVRRLDPRGRPAAEDGPLLAEAPAVAWMAYGIHGDELSSTDAAAALAYWLVAGEDRGDGAAPEAGRSHRSLRESGRTRRATWPRLFPSPTGRPTRTRRTSPTRPSGPGGGATTTCSI